MHQPDRRLPESDPHLKWQMSFLRQPDYVLRRQAVDYLRLNDRAVLNLLPVGAAIGRPSVKIRSGAEQSASAK